MSACAIRCTPKSFELSRLQMEYLSLGQRVEFGIGGNFRKFAHRGWSVTSEERITWSDGVESSIEFKIGPLKRDVLLKVAGTPFLAPSDRRQSVFVYLNGLFVGIFNAAGYAEHSLVASREAFSARKNTLTFAIPGASSPEANGISEDTRVLGFAFESLSVSEVAES